MPRITVNALKYPLKYGKVSVKKYDAPVPLIVGHARCHYHVPLLFLNKWIIILINNIIFLYNFLIIFQYSLLFLEDQSNGWPSVGRKFSQLLANDLFAYKFPRQKVLESDNKPMVLFVCHHKNNYEILIHTYKNWSGGIIGWNVN